MYNMTESQDLDILEASGSRKEGAISWVLDGLNTEGMNAAQKAALSAMLPVYLTDPSIQKALEIATAINLAGKRVDLEAPLREMDIQYGVQGGGRGSHPMDFESRELDKKYKKATSILRSLKGKTPDTDALKATLNPNSVLNKGQQRVFGEALLDYVQGPAPEKAVRIVAFTNSTFVRKP